MIYSNESHYLVASYRSSSKEYFPDNTPNKFHLKFAKPLLLKGDNWKVALCDIHFVNIFGSTDTSNKAADHYIIFFSHCDGILIDGQPSRAIRFVTQPKDVYICFEKLHYLPVTATQLDTCSFEICAYSETGSVPIELTEDSNIRLTLRFSRVFKP